MNFFLYKFKKRRSSSALFICRVAMEGYRLILRNVASDDLHSLFRWRRDDAVSALTNLEKPLVRHESPWHGTPPEYISR